MADPYNCNLKLNRKSGSKAVYNSKLQTSIQDKDLVSLSRFKNAILYEMETLPRLLCPTAQNQSYKRLNIFKAALVEG